MNSSNRIVFNTGILYVKLLIVMGLGLFSVRIILDALGETSYGIYTLVAGVVGMLGMLQGAMSRASMRFMSHSLGTNDEQLIIMATIVQRELNNSSSDDAVGITDEEKQQLMEELDKLNTNFEEKKDGK